MQCTLPEYAIYFTTVTSIDEDMARTRAWNADPIQVPIGPVTRARAKKLIRRIWAQACTWRPIEEDEQVDQPLTSMIQVLEESGA